MTNQKNQNVFLMIHCQIVSLVSVFCNAINAHLPRKSRYSNIIKTIVHINKLYYSNFISHLYKVRLLPTLRLRLLAIS